MIRGVSAFWKLPSRQCWRRHFHEEAGLRDPAIKAYVASLLVDFCDGPVLQNVPGAARQCWFDEFVVPAARSFEHERRVRKYAADCALFVAGMFPESACDLPGRHNKNTTFIDLIKLGKENYYMVSKFEGFQSATISQLFGMMSQQFEQIVYGLNQTKNDLVEMKRLISTYFDDRASEPRVRSLLQRLRAYSNSNQIFGDVHARQSKLG